MYNYSPSSQNYREVSMARAQYEAARGFDLDDDWVFCRALCTEEDYEIASASSNASLSSGSPHSSPLQDQSQPVYAQPAARRTPNFTLSSAANSHYQPLSYQPLQYLPSRHASPAKSGRNPIPIVNPQTGMRLPSPPSAVAGNAYRKW